MNPFAALLLGAATVAAAAPSVAPSPPPRPAMHDFAPADGYFGRMKLSYLGINNTFRDQAIFAGAHTTESNIVNRMAFAEDALSDWGKRYPHDPQLAHSYFLAIRAEQKIWIKADQERAWIYMNRVVALYPNSYFGKTIRRDMAAGFTEHYYSAPVMCVIPAPPSPTPVPVGKGLKVLVETPACIPPTPAPNATTSPEPTPTADAT